MLSLCILWTGVEDDGYPRGLTPGDLEQSLTTLRAMATEVHAACTLVRTLPGSNGRSCVVVRVHRICRDEVSYTDLRIAGEHAAISFSPASSIAAEKHSAYGNVYTACNAGEVRGL